MTARRALFYQVLVFLGLTINIFQVFPQSSPSDFVVDLSAAVSPTSPRIRLSWTQRLQSNIASQRIHRRLKGGVAWTLLADLATTATNYADTSCLPGVEYEYWMERSFTALSSSYMPRTSLGYINAGYNVPVVERRGKILLVIESTMTAPLAMEIAQLQGDLIGDGWVVQQIPVSRTSPVGLVKGLISAAYKADPASVRMVYLLGHVPVPYSGNNACDGHWQHLGAWSSDGYYGDMDGIWTDISVKSTGATSPRNHNVPADGKFDQSTFPTTLELAVGRVDFSGLTKAPSASVTEADLLRRYLAKAHSYRHQLGNYASIPRRAIIWDGLTSLYTGVTGWHWAYSGLGSTPGTVIDRIGSGQWFSTNFAGGRDYLIGYAGGYGSYETISGLGTSADFGSKPSRVVFMGMFGSYLGDWDSPNNIMRSALAGNATGDSLGLACIWAGTPNYFMHSMGMGEPIGLAVRSSQNAPLPGGTSFRPGGSQWGPSPPLGGVHTGLMGDPALRLHTVEPPRKLVAASSGGKVSLSWAASNEEDLAGYHVYRATAPDGPFTRVTAVPLLNPAFSEMRIPGESCTYLVKSVVLERVSGGTYYNCSQGSRIVVAVNGGTGTSGPSSPVLEPFALIWRVGQDDNPLAVPYVPHSEFSSENGLNDLPPGKITRLPMDPLYSTLGNPAKDDDYYCAGNYPIGFNGLTASLAVPNQEPSTAWERALTNGDLTNRVHFVLNGAQANPASRIRLNFEFSSGGFFLGAPVNQLGMGFGLHDVVIRFRNSRGSATTIYTNRLEGPTRVSVEFSASGVGASTGANTIEFVRVGPSTPATWRWIVFDYVSMETAVPKTTTMSGAPTVATGMQSGESHLPMPEGWIGGGSPGSVSLDMARVGGLDYLTLTYLRPEALSDTLFKVEATSDMKSWSDSGLVEMRSVLEGAVRRITVRDSNPVSENEHRFMRVRADGSVAN